jgi:hypothetical protein
VCLVSSSSHQHSCRTVTREPHTCCSCCCIRPRCPKQRPCSARQARPSCRCHSKGAASRGWQQAAEAWHGRRRCCCRGRGRRLHLPCSLLRCALAACCCCDEGRRGVHCCCGCCQKLLWDTRVLPAVQASHHPLQLRACGLYAGECGVVLGLLRLWQLASCLLCCCVKGLQLVEELLQAIQRICDARSTSHRQGGTGESAHATAKHSKEQMHPSSDRPAHVRMSSMPCTDMHRTVTVMSARGTPQQEWDALMAVTAAQKQPSRQQQDAHL